jgi:hypothetical protein
MANPFYSIETLSCRILLDLCGWTELVKTKRNGKQGDLPVGPGIPPLMKTAPVALAKSLFLHIVKSSEADIVVQKRQGKGEHEKEITIAT